MSARPAIYLDANAGLPPLQQVRDRLNTVLGQLYNPSSTHQPGRNAKAIFREARERVRASLGQLLSDFSDNQWIWTSGGTEGLQAALRASITAGQAKAWFYSPVEHSGSLGWLSQVAHHAGLRAIPLALDPHGRVDVARFADTHEQACRDGHLRKGEAFVVSFLWVNNETGVIQNQMDELLDEVRSRGGMSLVDGAQAWGKVKGAPLSLDKADWMAASGHKLGAFSGTGVLAFSHRARKLLESCPSYAGTQQSGLRAGTENLIGAWSLGEAAFAQAWKDEGVNELRAELEDRILAEIAGSRVQGRGVPRVGNTLNVSFEGVPKSSIPLTDLLDLEGFSVSSGSACSSGVRKPSHVLKALGHPDELALATLRISLAPDSRSDEVLEKFLPALKRVVELARKSR
jgi:cysteine desulfurase